MKTSRQFERATVAGELAERLAHQTSLHPDVAVAHVAFDLGLRDERRDGVDDDDVDGSGPNEHVGDLERLLAVVGLAHEKLVGLHAELPGVGGVESVLCVDERGDAARLLRLRDGVERERRLAARLRTVNLDDAPPRIAADAQRDVEPDAPGRDDLNAVGEARPFFEAHDRALAVLLLDGRDGQVDGLALVLGVVHGARLLGWGVEVASTYTAYPFSFQELSAPARARARHWLGRRVVTDAMAPRSRDGLLPLRRRQCRRPATPLHCYGRCGPFRPARRPPGAARKPRGRDSSSFRPSSSAWQAVRASTRSSAMRSRPSGTTRFSSTHAGFSTRPRRATAGVARPSRRPCSALAARSRSPRSWARRTTAHGSFLPVLREAAIRCASRSHRVTRGSARARPRRSRALPAQRSPVMTPAAARLWPLRPTGPIALARRSAGARLVQGLARTAGDKPLSPPTGRLRAEAGDAEAPVDQDLACGPRAGSRARRRAGRHAPRARRPARHRPGVHRGLAARPRHLRCRGVCAEKLSKPEPAHPSPRRARPARRAGTTGDRHADRPQHACREGVHTRARAGGGALALHRRGSSATRPRRAAST